MTGLRSPRWGVDFPLAAEGCLPLDSKCSREATEDCDESEEDYGAVAHWSSEDSCDAAAVPQALWVVPRQQQGCDSSPYDVAADQGGHGRGDTHRSGLVA